MNAKYMGWWFCSIMTAGLWLASGVTTQAGTYTWANVGTDWGTAANWGTNVVPGVVDTANFGGTGTVMPTIGDARSVSNLVFDGRGNWTFSGAGPLTITTNGSLTMQVSGTDIINPDIIICSNNIITVGKTSGSSFNEGLWLNGVLRGTGPLNVFAWSPPSQSILHYNNNNATNFTGGTLLTNSSIVLEWPMTNASGTYVFGLDAGGVNPGTITLNNVVQP